MARKANHDDIEKFYEYGIYIPTRTLWLGSAEYDGDDQETGVDFIMAEKAIKGLHILDSLAPAKDQPINILMNNIGGDEDHGLAIYDYIENCNNYVSMTILGNAQSMGAWILQAADERIVSKRAKIMIHEGTTELEASSEEEMDAKYKEYKRSSKMFRGLLLEKIKLKHPDFKEENLKKWLRKDSFFTPEEAVYYGLADKIL